MMIGQTNATCNGVEEVVVPGGEMTGLLNLSTNSADYNTSGTQLSLGIRVYNIVQQNERVLRYNEDDKVLEDATINHYDTSTTHPFDAPDGSNTLTGKKGYERTCSTTPAELSSLIGKSLTVVDSAKQLWFLLKDSDQGIAIRITYTVSGNTITSITRVALLSTSSSSWVFPTGVFSGQWQWYSTVQHQVLLDSPQPTATNVILTL